MRNDLSYNIISAFSREIESVFFEILLPNSKPITAETIYCPPNQTNFLELLNENINNIDSISNKIYILDNININWSLLFSHKYIHTFMHACMHAYIYIYICVCNNIYATLWCSNFSELKHKTWLHFDKEFEWWGDGVGWGVVDSYQGVGGGRGGGYYLIVCLFFFTCAFTFCSLMSCLIF